VKIEIELTFETAWFKNPSAKENSKENVEHRKLLLPNFSQLRLFVNGSKEYK
jgi:hypothetical protein